MDFAVRWLMWTTIASIMAIMCCTYAFFTVHAIMVAPWDLLVDSEFLELVFTNSIVAYLLYGLYDWITRTRSSHLRGVPVYYFFFIGVSFALWISWLFHYVSSVANFYIPYKYISVEVWWKVPLPHVMLGVAVLQNLGF